MSGWPHRAGRCAALAASMLAALAGVAAAASSPGPQGTYRLQGTARVVARPVIARTVEVHADAILRPGPSPRVLLVRVAAEGFACDLEASLDGAGALAFRPEQRCSLDSKSNDTRGHVDARLRAGSGKVGGGELALDLSWDLSGTVSFRTGGTAEVAGTKVDVPGSWTPGVPVRGEAQGSATGRRDASKAAEPVR